MAPRAASPTMKGSPRKSRAPSKSAAKGPAASAGTLQRSRDSNRLVWVHAAFPSRPNDSHSGGLSETRQLAGQSGCGGYTAATDRTLGVALRRWPASGIPRGQVLHPTYGVRYALDTKMPMRDGVDLSGDIYLPDAPGQFPTALIRTPYDNNTPESIASARAFAQDGYACVVQDVRGRWDSDGSYYPLPQRGRRRLRHPRVDWATTVEQRPHRHERPLLSGAGAVAQRAPGQPVSHVSGAARGMRGVSGRSGAAGRRVAAHDGPHLGHAHQRPHGAEHRLFTTGPRRFTRCRLPTWTCARAGDWTSGAIGWRTIAMTSTGRTLALRTAGTRLACRRST